jgi:hypothetical protein
MEMVTMSTSAASDFESSHRAKKRSDCAATIRRNPSKNFNAMLCVLAQCGYVTDDQPFARDLHKLNLISNAVKHGHGHSLTQLAEEFPDLFLDRAPNEPLVLEHLFLTPAQATCGVGCSFLGIVSYTAILKIERLGEAELCCINLADRSLIGISKHSGN